MATSSTPEPDDTGPLPTRSLVAKAIADGHEDDSYSRLIDYFG